jgi:hypothetical protein
MSFWGVIAAEYGNGVSPYVMEETWKHSVALNGPPTPCTSPDAQTVNPYPVYKPQPTQQLLTPVQDTKTSISALLGIDASPRSPKERELIKRMEESRDIVMT